MHFKPVSAWWSLLLLALAGAARADTDLGPYSIGASETVEHDSNVTRSLDDLRRSDWISTTQINGAIDQTLGRGQLVANGLFDINRYKRAEDHDLDSNTYDLTGAYNWNSVHDLSGSFGADSRRRQYFYGFDGDLPGAGTSAQLLARDLETDNHAFANFQLGGISRWTLFAGGDVNQRKYSNDAFETLDERQWSGHGGTSYATSPDLSFGVQGDVTRGLYPHYFLEGDHDAFDMKSLDLTTKWQVSGASALDATAGYTHVFYTGQGGTGYVNGSLNWTWKPPSHVSIVLGLSRDSDSDTSAFGALANTNSIQGRSINNAAHVDVTYEVSPKTSVVLNGRYTLRRYENSIVPILGDEGSERIDGSNRTWLLGLTGHLQPTRTTDLSCGVSREVRTVDASLAPYTPAYTDNIVLCVAAVKFD